MNFKPTAGIDSDRVLLTTPRHTTWRH